MRTCWLCDSGSHCDSKSPFLGQNHPQWGTILICLTSPDPRGKREVVFAKRKDWWLSWGSRMRHTTWACPAASINYDLLKCIFSGTGILGKLFWMLRSYNWMRWSSLRNKVIWNTARSCWLDVRIVTSLVFTHHFFNSVLRECGHTQSVWISIYSMLLMSVSNIAGTSAKNHGNSETIHDICYHWFCTGIFNKLEQMKAYSINIDNDFHHICAITFSHWFTQQRLQKIHFSKSVPKTRSAM